MLLCCGNLQALWNSHFVCDWFEKVLIIIRIEIWNWSLGIVCTAKHIHTIGSPRRVNTQYWIRTIQLFNLERDFCLYNNLPHMLFCLVRLIIWCFNFTLLFVPPISDWFKAMQAISLKAFLHWNWTRSERDEQRDESRKNCFFQAQIRTVIVWIVRKQQHYFRLVVVDLMHSREINLAHRLRHSMYTDAMQLSFTMKG